MNKITETYDVRDDPTLRPWVEHGEAMVTASMNLYCKLRSPIMVSCTAITTATSATSATRAARGQASRALRDQVLVDLPRRNDLIGAREDDVRGASYRRGV